MVMSSRRGTKVTFGRYEIGFCRFSHKHHLKILNPEARARKSVSNSRLL